MNLLKLIASLIEEYDCSIAINEQRNYITFRKNSKLRSRLTGAVDSYRVTVKDTGALITRVRIHSKGGNGRPYFIPDEKVLSSVDLHDPRSLKAIREWLKTLR